MTILTTTHPGLIGHIQNRFVANGEDDTTAIGVTLWIDFDSLSVELPPDGVPCPTCGAETDEPCREVNIDLETFEHDVHYQRRMVLAAVRVLLQKGLATEGARKLAEMTS